MAVAEEKSGRPGAPVRPDRNLALELVRVTESAAMGAGRWVGRGDKIAADQAAVAAKAALVDLTIDEPDIEEIVRRIYEGEPS